MNARAARGTVLSALGAIERLTTQLADDSSGARSDERRRLCDDLHHEIDRARAALGDEVSAVGARDRKLSSIDLAALVRDAMKPLRAQLDAAQLVLVDSLRANVEVHVDALEIGWVVASLIGNALRYSPPHAQILVMLTATESEAELRIVDHGPGIAAHVRERLFDPEGGRGLTLVLIGEIIAAHGGSIAVRSELGKGCAFVITLPARVGPVETPPSSSDEST